MALHTWDSESIEGHVYRMGSTVMRQKDSPESMVTQGLDLTRHTTSVHQDG